jgi:hypothetical protein
MSATALPSVHVSDRASERIREVLAAEASARFVRIDVGIG